MLRSYGGWWYYLAGVAAWLRHLRGKQASMRTVAIDFWNRAMSVIEYKHVRIVKARIDIENTAVRRDCKSSRPRVVSVCFRVVLHLLPNKYPRCYPVPYAGL